MTVPRLPSGLARNRVFFRSSAYAGGTLNSATLSKLSPSYRFIMPNLAPQTRVAFSSIAWNTGSNSPGEELMICSTSDRNGELVPIGPAEIPHMDRPAVDNGPPRNVLRVDWKPCPESGNRSMLCLEYEMIVLPQRNNGVVRFAKLARTFHNSVEHRSNIGRRRCDHLEDITASSLINQRLLKIARLGLHLIE